MPSDAPSERLDSCVMALAGRALILNNDVDLGLIINGLQLPRQVRSSEWAGHQNRRCEQEFEVDHVRVEARREPELSH